MKNVTAIATATLQAELDTRRLSPALLVEAEQMGAKRAATFLAARALLAELLSQLFDCATLPAIVIHPGGKPAFVDNALPFFNLAHSGNQLLVAVSDAGPVGCDVEIIRARRGTSALAEAFFSAEENQWLKKQADPLTAFWQLWCQREALLKQQGQGIWSMANVSLQPQQRTFSTTSLCNKKFNKPDQDLQLYHAVNHHAIFALAVPAKVNDIQQWNFSSENNQLIEASPQDWQCYQQRRWQN